MLEVSLQTRVHFQAVSQLAGIGSPIGRRPIGPALSWFGESLAGGLYLAHRTLATHYGGLGACRLTSVFLRHIGAVGFRVKKHGLAVPVSGIA